MNLRSAPFLGLLAASLALPRPLGAREISASNGVTSGAVLKITPAARAAAMGEAFSGLADDVSALYYNPAGLIQIESFEVAAMHALWLGGTSFNYLAFGARPYGNLAFAGAVQHFRAGGIERRNIGGQALGEVSPADLVLDVGTAYRVTGIKDPEIWWDGWTLGFKLKMIHSKIVNSDTTFNGGIGIFSPALWRGRARFGWSFDNIGGSLKHDSEDVKVPSFSRLGVSVIPARDIVLAGQVTVASDAKTSAALGAERYFSSESEMTIIGRLGINTRTLNQIDGLSTVSAGIGFQFPKLRFDYALVPFGDIGLTHRMGLTYRWGDPPQIRKKKVRRQLFLDRQEEKARKKRLDELHKKVIDAEEGAFPFIPWID